MTHTFDMDKLSPEDLARIIALRAAIEDDQYLLNHLDLIDFRQAPVTTQWTQEQAHGSKNQQHRHP